MPAKQEPPPPPTPTPLSSTEKELADVFANSTKSNRPASAEKKEPKKDQIPMKPPTPTPAPAPAPAPAPMVTRSVPSPALDTRNGTAYEGSPTKSNQSNQSNQGGFSPRQDKRPVANPPIRTASPLPVSPVQNGENGTKSTHENGMNGTNGMNGSTIQDQGTKNPDPLKLTDVVDPSKFILSSSGDGRKKTKKEEFFKPKETTPSNPESNPSNPDPFGFLDPFKGFKK